MVAVYVNLIINGRRTVEAVPTVIREQVRQALIDKGYEEYAGGQAAE